MSWKGYLSWEVWSEMSPKSWAAFSEESHLKPAMFQQGSFVSHKKINQQQQFSQNIPNQIFYCFSHLFLASGIKQKVSFGGAGNNEWTSQENWIRDSCKATMKKIIFNELRKILQMSLKEKYS